MKNLNAIEMKYIIIAGVKFNLLTNICQLALKIRSKAEADGNVIVLT